MSELIVFQGHEFRVRRRPDFITRLRARLAWRAYQKAERPYLRFAREFEVLEAQREAAVAKYGTLVRQGVAEDNAEIAHIGRELDRINRRFAELAAPSQKAEAAMIAAKVAADRILAKIGFEPASSDEHA